MGRRSENALEFNYFAIVPQQFHDGAKVKMQMLVTFMNYGFIIFLLVDAVLIIILTLKY